MLKLMQKTDFPEFVKTRLRRVLNTNAGRTLVIGLPGGRSISGAITGIAMLKDSELNHLQIQLIDERVSGEKNYDTLMNAGMRNLIESGRIRADQFRTVTSEYDPGLPEFDILFAGIGEDGHFASLFPASYPSLANPATANTVRITDAPKQPPERVTVTYTGFRKLAGKAEIYLLFFGKSKRTALTRLMHKESPETLPCSFFIKYFDRSQVTVVSDTEADSKYKEREKL